MRGASSVLLALVTGCGLLLDVGSDGTGEDAGSTREDAAVRADAARADGSDPTSTGDATVAADASSDADVPIVPGCGGPSALYDRFDAPSPYWGVAAGTGAGTARAESGVLRITPPTTTGGSTTRVLSTFAYDARNDRVAVRVPTVHAGARVATFFELYFDGDRILGMSQEDGMLYSYRLDGGSTGSAMATYSPTTHLWWQIRGDGTGNVAFETSPDGTSWTALQIAAGASWVEGVHVSLGVHVRGTSAGGFAEFDDLNYDPGHVHTVYCPASSFADPFDGPPDPIRWAPTPSCTVTAAGGSLQLEGGGPSEPCALFTRHAYDVRSAPALVDRGTTEDDSLVFAIADAADVGATLQCDALGVRYAGPSGSASGGACARVWRYHADADMLVASTSNDGAAWTGYSSSADTLSPGAVRILLRNDSVTGTGVASVAGYNVLSP